MIESAQAGSATNPSSQSIEESQVAERRRICVVTAGGPYAWIVINALGSVFGPIDVVLEQPEGRIPFLRRRARKIGWIATAGQFGTMVLVRLGKRLSSARIDRIDREFKVDQSIDEAHPVTNLATINSKEFLDVIGRLNPDVLLLTGCRVMRKDILQQLKMPVLNYHAGITPQYRGMNGAYWALRPAGLYAYG